MDKKEAPEQKLEISENLLFETLGRANMEISLYKRAVVDLRAKIATMQLEIETLKAKANPST